MESETERHSSIHTMTLFAKRKPNRIMKTRKISHPSTIIMNQNAHLQDQNYIQHLQQYYEQLQNITQVNNHKRIKSDILEFIACIISQLALTTLKYLIVQNCSSSNIKVLIQTFSIISFFSGIYFISLHILNFGLSAFLKIYFCLDKLMVILISICFANSTAISVLGFSASQTVSLQFFFPFWLFYSAGTVRIQVMNYKWAKLQIIISKIIHLVSFSLVLTSTYQFIYYERYLQIARINSYLIVIMYGVAVSLYFVEFYRMISKFDGTNDLSYQYQFQSIFQAAIRKKKKELQQKLQNWKS